MSPDRQQSRRYAGSSMIVRLNAAVPVVVDGSGQVAISYGLAAFPYWVAVDADGTLANRLTGELTPEQLDAPAILVSCSS